MESQLLDEAKVKLRASLSKLESIVDQKISLCKEESALSNDQEEAELLIAKNELDEKQAEAIYLRDENNKIRTELGQAVEENKNLQKKNRNAAVRVDNIIAQLQATLN